MARMLTVGAAQLGPISREEPRAAVVDRLIALLAQAGGKGCRLVVFPELALTTFFPRWYMEEQAEVDEFFERDMPGKETRRLFDEAARRGIGFHLGYAELTEDAGGNWAGEPARARRFNGRVQRQQIGL
ncbi:MAG: nitrilase-related carbon-nitrogen hydrolase, partial [Nitrospinaceae bacterium]